MVSLINSKPIPWRPLVGVVSNLCVLGLIVTAGINLLERQEIGIWIGTAGFAVATSVACLYRLVNPFGWSILLHGFGYPVSVYDATRVWILSESRRWLPGGVWGYASRTVQAGKLGVPIGTAVASTAVETALTVLAACVLSLVGLALYSGPYTAWLSQFELPRPSTSILVVATGLLLSVGATGWYFRDRVANGIESAKASWSQFCHLKWATVIGGVGFSYLVAMGLLNGLVNVLLVQSMSTSSAPSVAILAATSAAWLTGYLTFFAPGGLVVREATFAALLAPWLPYELALTVAILARLAQLVAEVVCLMLAISIPAIARGLRQSTSHLVDAAETQAG